MKASYFKYVLNFKRPSGTSRGVLIDKETWFIKLESQGKKGIGECGILRTLSYDDRPDYEQKLKWTCQNIHLGLEVLLEELKHYPSIQFGLEQAFLSLESIDPFVLFESEFTNSKDSIIINGLIWMGEPEFMSQQIQQKLQENFSCLKLKIGAIDFNKEFELLSYIRDSYTKQQVELRVDANGGFSNQQALKRLEKLATLDLHSIEQPIKAGNIQEMAQLCKQTPVPIALDEELIGVIEPSQKQELLDSIMPQYIILKPSLVGGIKGCMQWIDLAKQRNIDYWITSALESNIGLNAIAQWTYTLGLKTPQGLGTGALYTNNIESPLVVTKGKLHYNNNKVWNCDWL
ncbi:o-succinylbenzoate synthase [Myroides sp. LJL110]